MTAAGKQMSGIAASVLAGACAGLSIAAPFGPTSLYLIERTLADGMRAGVATGLGVATVHLVYSTLVVAVGITSVGDPAGAAMLTIASGSVLAYFAWRIWRRELRRATLSETPVSLLRVYCDAVAVGLLNPLTPALCAAAMAAVAGSAWNPSELLVTGVFAGSLAWWLTLSSLVSLVKRRLSLQHLQSANRAAGLILALFASSLLARGLHALGQIGI